MAFISELKNYSTQYFPQNTLKEAPFNTFKKEVTFGGTRYSFQQQIVNTATEEYSGIPISQISSYSPIVILKSKTMERYFLWQFRDNGYISPYVNNTPSIDGAVKIEDGLSIPGFLNANWFLAVRNDFIGMAHWQNGCLISFGFSMESILSFMESIEDDVYSEEYGKPSKDEKYGGTFDDESDTIPIPSIPVTGVTNVGFINVYKTFTNGLQNLGSELFPNFVELDPDPSQGDVAEVIAQGFSNLSYNISQFVGTFINSNLINYIIDCHIIPVSPQVGESERIRIGFKEFTQTANRVTSDYVDFDCGTINIKEYYGNFIDYVGTRVQLYLPFIGFVPIKNEYFQNGYLQVIYRFNIVDGSFMCFVLSSSSKSELQNSVVGTYSGNACVHLPITGLNYSTMLSGVVTGAISTTANLKGNVSGAVNSALNTLSLKPDIQGSNSYNSTSAYLGVRYPYLLIEREVSNFSINYPNEYGLPLNVTTELKNLKGFVQVDENVHIHINALKEEKDMIYDLLTDGIIIW